MSLPSRPQSKVPGATRLVTDRTERVPTTRVADTDTRTALVRGLREYLETVMATTTDGRFISIAKLVDTWPDGLDISVFPGGAVYADGEGSYDASGFSPGFRRDQTLPGGGWYVCPAEYTVPISVDIACRDKGERTALGRAIEDALNPVDWMYGCRLVLPHYHSAIGVYELAGGGYEDSPDKALAGRWVLKFRITGQVAQIKVFEGRVPATAKATVGVVDP